MSMYILSMDFKSHAMAQAKSYTVLLMFIYSLGCHPAMGECNVVTGNLIFDSNKVIWDIMNNDDNPLTISSISLNWPVQNGALTSICLGTDTIYEPDKNPSSTLVDSNWHGTVDKRSIAPGQSSRLMLIFANSVCTTSSLYSLNVKFGKCKAQYPIDSIPGCSISGPDIVCDVESVWDNASLVEVQPYVYSYKWKVDNVGVGMEKNIRIDWKSYSSGYHILNLNVIQTWGDTTISSEYNKQVRVIKKPIVKITITRS
jgi:hypothetical protein